MSVAHCFDYVANSNARVLIIGSMPGVASLTAQRYYAHERNQFWPIMLSLFHAEASMPYPQKLAVLMKNGIALWDVLAECYREGSLDTAIARDSMRCNDFLSFFSKHHRIGVIAFNGKTAQHIYQRRVLPTLTPAQQQLRQLVLPSSSPAHASVPLSVKQQQWHQLLSSALSS